MFSAGHASRYAFASVLFFAISAPLHAQDAHAQDAGVKLDVPFVPTPPDVVDRMLELGEVGEGDYVIDLGSGDGRIAIAAVKAGADRALGVDIDPKRIEEATENAEKEGVSDKVTFRRENLFETEIADADVITMYLLSRVNLDLRPRLLEELRPGTRVVSHAFSMGDWKPDRHEKVEFRDVYLWIIPARIEGRWDVTAGDHKFSISLSQDYQQIEGTATVDGKPAPLTGAQLRGDEIEFSVEGMPETFTGRVDGDKIEGDGDNNWQAVRTERKV